MEKAWLPEYPFLRPGDVFNALFENSPDIIMLVDRQCRVLKGNNQFSLETGIDDPAGLDISVVLHEECREAARESITQCFGSGSPTFFEHSLRPDRWFSSRVIPIKSDGAITHVIVMSSYNRDRRRTETALRESERKLRAITTHMGEGLYVLDPGGTVRYMNPAAERLLGWTIEELWGRNVHDVFHYLKADGSPLTFRECPIRRVLEEDGPFVSNEEVFVRKDGVVFPVSVIASPLMEEGKKVATITVFNDITSRKALEHQLVRTQKLESVGILAGGIAHDFNNILQAILGYITMAGLSIVPGHEAHDKLRRAEESVARARELSLRLLTFSKGGEPFKRVTTVQDLLQDASVLSLGGSNISCDYDIPAGLHRVEADVGQVRQVLHNLLINAREAMPEGGAVNIAAENIELEENHNAGAGEGEYVKISVTDNGRGISPENLEKVFDPYFTTKGMGSDRGTGLGLAVCHSIIRKHGGLMSVSSEPGKGSKFSIYLPSADRHSKVLAVGNYEISARKSILFMDDDAVVRKIMTDVVRRLGYDVSVASNGEEAVDLYRHYMDQGCPFDLVILDLTVHDGMGGEMAMRKLRELDPDVRGVISSGYAESELLRNFRDHGFAGAIAKPYRMQELRVLLGRLIP
ncbi:MAG: PAS domain S-box protein [Nitrospirae bacterium]|nr:PAS domain S-box protein [Nitrospirota bacterium]